MDVDQRRISMGCEMQGVEVSPARHSFSRNSPFVVGLEEIGGPTLPIPFLSSSTADSDLQTRGLWSMERDGGIREDQQKESTGRALGGQWRDAVDVEGAALISLSPVISKDAGTGGECAATRRRTEGSAVESTLAQCFRSHKQLAESGQAANEEGSSKLAFALDEELEGFETFGVVDLDPLFGEEELREPDFDGELPAFSRLCAPETSSKHQHRSKSCSPLREIPVLETALGSSPYPSPFSSSWRVKMEHHEDLPYCGGGEGMSLCGAGSFCDDPLVEVTGTAVYTIAEATIEPLRGEKGFGQIFDPSQQPGKRSKSHTSTSSRARVLVNTTATNAAVDFDDEEREGGDDDSAGQRSPSSSPESSIGGDGLARRRSRRRVHPVSKFANEEVCWTPDDESDEGQMSGEEGGPPPPRNTRFPTRSTRSRGRHGRRNGWEGGNKRRKQHNPWSLDETRALVRGVEVCGGGKWADIKRLGFKEIASRSPVDLKDKWRNLLRVALLPPEQIRLKKIDRRQDLPIELLYRVRELAQERYASQCIGTNTGRGG